MPERRRETIEDIAAELRLGFRRDDVKAYFCEVADRIEAAHQDGIVRAIEQLMETRD